MIYKSIEETFGAGNIKNDKNINIIESKMYNLNKTIFICNREW